MFDIVESTRQGLHLLPFYYGLMTTLEPNRQPIKFDQGNFNDAGVSDEA